MKKFNKVIGGLAVAFVLGCSGNPQAIQMMREHKAQQSAQQQLKTALAEQWRKGAALVAAGKNRISAAELNPDKNAADIELGLQEISQGQEMMQSADSYYRRQFPGFNLEDGNLQP